MVMKRSNGSQPADAATAARTRASKALVKLEDSSTDAVFTRRLSPMALPPSVQAGASPRTALVTGAGRRLGREIALTLARAGWNVAVHHRHSVADAQQTVADCLALTGRVGSAQAFFADLADETSVRALLPAVIAHFGQADAVVNSASTFENDSAQNFGFQTMELHLRANTGAPVLLAQALHAHLHGGERQGAVVNLLDQKLWNMNPDFFSYTLSKAALEAANTMLAMTLAPQIRVVGVAPGLTLTSHLLNEQQFAELHKQSPLGRSSTPEDVAATVAFALTNQSITGTTLLVDGGQHLMRFERDFSLMPTSAPAP
jgi:NAD(P)-dependent dehydrogenase (short-subunit alcohol dehydrogenase family)